MGDPWKERFAAFGLIPAPTPTKLVATAAAPGSTDERERAYALGALASASAQLGATGDKRNDALKVHAWALIGFVNTGALTEQEYIDALTAAGRTASGLGDHPFTDAEIAATLRGSITKGRAQGLTRYAPDDFMVTEVSLTNGAAVTNGQPVLSPAAGRVITWTRGSDVATAAPVWAWHYRERGRIQLGTLALLAGRPGAGKSTAARWFAAQVTLGQLEGCWAGRPQHVAYIASEESRRYTIGPGLVAAGADMTRIHFPSVTRDGEPVALLSTLDENALAAYCSEHRCTVVIVDPLMSTVTAATDINKNNEIRNQIAPWARLADTVDGIALGVVHLRKNSTGDVVAAITGSSAFGEVARAIFGFAKNLENDTRVMSQHKNSTGYEDLSLTYQIASVPVTLTDGKVADIGAFAITGDSEITVEDLLSDGMHNMATGTTAECQRWLKDYLSVEGPIKSRAVKTEGQKEGYPIRTVERAANRLKVIAESRDFPRTTYWKLPDIVAPTDPTQSRHESRHE